MLFNSPAFLFFALAVFGLYAAARGPAARRALLLGASYLFYAHWDVRFLPLLLLSTAVDFAAARRVARAAPGARRRAWLGVSLATNLGALGVFKYGSFALESLGSLGFEATGPLPALPGEIPIGISFYTFQTLSYTIDCYRGRIAPTARLGDFALYVAFFPQLVAGPIVRAADLLPQLRALGPLRLDDVGAGAQRFVRGLFKKVVIADNVGLFVDAVFAAPEQHGALTLWCGAYGFALQIYCDFSGYTDMAIGLARALGVRLPENFDRPYLATSVTDFWRRWHISLSTWLRDYLYIPLGGSRGPAHATHRNLMLTMLLGGLWHGAAWTFVLWGAFHGALLAAERAAGVGRGAPPRNAGPLLRAASGAATLHAVCLGWVIFRAPDFGVLATYLRGLFAGGGAWDAATGTGLGWAAALLGLLAWQRAGSELRGRRLWAELPPSLQGAAVAAGVLLVALLRVDEVAFIYFQF